MKQKGLPKKNAFSGREEASRKVKPFQKTAHKKALLQRSDAIADFIATRTYSRRVRTIAIPSLRSLQISPPQPFIYTINEGGSFPPGSLKFSFQLSESKAFLM